MPIFTILFERRDPAGTHDYRPLLSELQGQKCFPLWDNAWLGSFQNNATQVHNYFKRLLAEADRIAGCEMTNHFCYSGVVPGANKWLELNPPAGGLDGARSPEQAAPVEPPAKAAPRKVASVKPAAKVSAKTSPATPAAPKAAAPSKSGAETSAAAGKQPAGKSPAKPNKTPKRS